MRKILFNGGAQLSGNISIKGSKNFATKAIIASLLTKENCVLYNVPGIRDVDITLGLLRYLNVEHEYCDNSTIILNSKLLKLNELPQTLTSQTRISTLLLGPLLTRLGKVHISLPGGCKIGSRPIDLHLNFLEAFGAKINSINNDIWASADSLHGCHFRLNYPSTSTTEHIILTAVLAKGTTVIENPSKTPETQALINMLNTMGARIIIENQNYIVEGVDELAGSEYSILPDRNEAVTFVTAAIVCQAELCITNFQSSGMESFLQFLDKIKVLYSVTDNSIVISKPSETYRMTSIESGPYPEFETDWIPLAMLLMNKCSGTGYIHERVFEDRLKFTKQLSKMGMNIFLSSKCLGNNECAFKDKFVHSAMITGNRILKGSELYLPDLRGGAALTIAALSAENHSIIIDDEVINRGYESYYERLAGIGAKLTFLE
jgi:UDP-N-acetylglucosamine 1-carboxyvinyltransferase